MTVWLFINEIINYSLSSFTMQGSQGRRYPRRAPRLLSQGGPGVIDPRWALGLFSPAAKFLNDLFRHLQNKLLSIRPNFSIIFFSHLQKSDIYSKFLFLFLQPNFHLSFTPLHLLHWRHRPPQAPASEPGPGAACPPDPLSTALRAVETKNKRKD